MPLGAHMSIAGGVANAILRGKSAGCETIQIFTKNSNRWRAKSLTPRDIDLFQTARRETGIDPILAHTSYLINLASPDEDLWEKSLNAFQVELERCVSLRIPYLIFHPGAHSGAGEEVGLNRVTQALNEVFERVEDTSVTVLIETTAGQGTGLGYSFEHIARLIEENFHPERLGVCFDTCHAFAAGYDLRTPDAFERTLEEFDKVIGFDRLKAVHLNDSKGGLGSRLDRHEHIGMGRIGLEGFRFLVNHPQLRLLPMVLETPKGPDMKEDVENLAVLRSLIEE
ncbi:MAG TPA: deoxyribonuclease IV [Syntrophomonadaceae bacterium]|nr:deoxyribonuclease IV [Syntrophomonadaceae bacterium]